mgnify:CR=1 FL=1
MYAGGPLTSVIRDAVIAHAEHEEAEEFAKLGTKLSQQELERMGEIGINAAKAVGYRPNPLAGALMSEANQRAGFGLRDKADQFLAKLMNIGASATNTLGLIDGTTATNVYDLLVVPASVKLDEANVPREGRWIVIPPWLNGRLILDGRFIKANESADSSTQIGRAHV